MKQQPDGTASKWLDERWIQGCVFGGLLPLMVGLYLIVTTIEWSAAERSEPSDGTRAAGGILVILFGCPLMAMLGALSGYFYDRTLDGIDEKKDATQHEDGQR